MVEEFVSGDDKDNSFVSSDETWTTSIEGKNADEAHDLVNDGSMSQEKPIQFKDFYILYNIVDSDLECGYVEEMKELMKWLLYEFNTISNKSYKQATTLNANQVLNMVLNADIFFSVLASKINL